MGINGCKNGNTQIVSAIIKENTSVDKNSKAGNRIPMHRYRGLIRFVSNT